MNLAERIPYDGTQPVVVTGISATKYRNELAAKHNPPSPPVSSHEFAFHVRLAAQMRHEPLLVWDHLAPFLDSAYGSDPRGTFTTRH